LKSKLEDIKAEGVENRYARHARLNKTVRDHILAKGFKLFPKDGYSSVTLNCFANTLNIDLGAHDLAVEAWDAAKPTLNKLWTGRGLYNGADIFIHYPQSTPLIIEALDEIAVEISLLRAWLNAKPNKETP